MATCILRAAWLLTTVCTVSSVLNVATPVAKSEEESHEQRWARLESQVLSFQKKHNSNVEEILGQASMKNSTDDRATQRLAKQQESSREHRRAQLEAQVLNFQRKHNSNVEELRSQSQMKQHSSDRTLARVKATHNVQSTPADPAGATPAEPAAPAVTVDPQDILVKEDFTRRCKFGTTVKGKDFLPRDQLDQFCSDHTDSLVDCKTQMTRMRTLHREGGDMDIFCLSIFQWFLKKYGGNCPKQCDKTMCRSTCSWLSEKKLADNEEKIIQEKMAEFQVTKNKLDGMEEEEDKMEKQIAKWTDKVANSRLVLNRTKTELDAKTQAYILLTHEQENKTSDCAAAKVRMVAAEEVMEEANEVYMQAKFLVDKAELELSSLKRATKSLESVSATLEVSIEDQRAEIAKVERHLRDLDYYKTEDEGKLAELLPPLHTAEVNLNTSQQELASAEAQLTAARASGDTVSAFDVLVNARRNSLREASKIFAKLDMERKQLEKKIEICVQDINMTNTELNATRVEKSRLDALKVAQEAELDTSRNMENMQEGNVTLAKDRMVAAKTNYSTWEDTTDEETRVYKEKLTLQKQAEFATKRAKRKVDKLDAKAYDQEKVILNLEAEMADVVREYEDNKLIYQAINDVFGPEYQALLARKATHDGVVAALMARRPEIVIQHRLGQ